MVHADNNNDDIVDNTTSAFDQQASPSPRPAHSPTDAKSALDTPKFKEFYKASLNCSLLQPGQYPTLCVSYCQD